MFSTKLSCAGIPLEYIVGKSNGPLQAVVPTVVFLFPMQQSSEEYNLLALIHLSLGDLPPC